MHEAANNVAEVTNANRLNFCVFCVKEERAGSGLEV